MLQFDASPYIAENKLRENAQIVSPYVCELLSMAENLDFLKFNKLFFLDLRSFGFYAA
jgi:hypothetical protein